MKLKTELTNKKKRIKWKANVFYSPKNTGDKSLPFKSSNNSNTNFYNEWIWTCIKMTLAPKKMKYDLTSKLREKQQQ